MAEILMQASASDWWSLRGECAEGEVLLLEACTERRLYHEIDVSDIENAGQDPMWLVEKIIDATETMDDVACSLSSDNDDNPTLYLIGWVPLTEEDKAKIVAFQANKLETQLTNTIDAIRKMKQKYPEMFQQVYDEADA